MGIDQKKLTRRQMAAGMRDENTPLAPNEVTFAHAFVRTGFFHEAAKESGSTAISRESLSQVGSLMYKRPNVKAYILKLKEARAAAAGIDDEWLLHNLKEVAHRCLQKEAVLEWNGEAWVESGEWKFDSTGANKAFELIGKHIGFFEKDNNSKRALVQINIDKDDAGL